MAFAGNWRPLPVYRLPSEDHRKTGYSFILAWPWHAREAGGLPHGRRVVAAKRDRRGRHALRHPSFSATSQSALSRILLENLAYCTSSPTRQIKWQVLGEHGILNNSSTKFGAGCIYLQYTRLCSSIIYIIIIHCGYAGIIPVYRDCSRSSPGRAPPTLMGNLGAKRGGMQTGHS